MNAQTVNAVAGIPNDPATLHFRTQSWIVAAMSYLRVTPTSSDYEYCKAGAFALWLEERHIKPAFVYDWRAEWDRFYIEWCGH